MNENLKPIRLGGLFDKPGSTHQAGSIWDTNSIGPTIDTMQGGYRQPLIIEEINDMKKLTISYGFKLTPKEIAIGKCLTSRYYKGFSNYNPENAVLEIEEINDMDKVTTRGSDIASTLRATIYKQGTRNLIENYKTGKGYEGVLEMGNTIRIRKLTPTECYKLMGFTVEDCQKASDGGVSNSQLYKQAGNSIVVNVLEAIFTSLGEKYEEFKAVGR